MLKERFGATVLQGLLAALGVGEHFAHHSVGGLVLLFAQGEVGDVEGTLRKILIEVLGKTGKPQRARDACRSAKQVGFAACPPIVTSVNGRQSRSRQHWRTSSPIPATTGRYTMGALALGAGYMVTCFSHAAMYDSFATKGDAGHIDCVMSRGRALCRGDEWRQIVHFEMSGG